SIHAPLAGSDAQIPRQSAFLSRFQSTLPSRGATVKQINILSVSQ
ncbi:hypothetical protein HMPREF1986_02867, partial [Oribacterium sp. oral taxon 078 str. F0263]